MPQFSIGGSNIQLVVGSTVVGNAMSVRLNVSRKVNPLYGLGSIDPDLFGRSVRLITGSLDYVIFDVDNVFEAIKAQQKHRIGALGASGKLFGIYDQDFLSGEIDTIGNLAEGVTAYKFVLRNITEFLPVDIMLIGIQEDDVSGAYYKAVMRDVVFNSEDFGVDVDGTAPVKRLEFLCRKFSGWHKAQATA